MGFKKYITRKIILRISLIITIFCAAAIFDSVYKTSPDKEATEKQDQTSDAYFSPVFYFSSANSTTKGADRFFQKLLFSISENEFLEKYHNFRNGHVVKTEELTKNPSFLALSHFMKYNICHQSSEEDLPSLFII